MVATTSAEAPKRQWFRSVDNFDGQNLIVDGEVIYELGNYLGGGVAGVVYEGEYLAANVDDQSDNDSNNINNISSLNSNKFNNFGSSSPLNIQSSSPAGSNYNENYVCSTPPEHTHR